MYYLLFLIILFNLLCNVYTMQHYGKVSFNYKLSFMQWYKKIPYMLWNWLTTITYDTNLWYLIYTTGCAIIFCALITLLIWLTKITWLFAIVIMLVIASAAVFYTNLIYSLFKRKKKKKTNDNK